MEEEEWRKATPDGPSGVLSPEELFGNIFLFFFLGGLCAFSHSANHWQGQEKGQRWISGCVSVPIACCKHSQKTKRFKWQE